MLTRLNEVDDGGGDDNDDDNVDENPWCTNSFEWLC